MKNESPENQEAVFPSPEEFPKIGIWKSLLVFAAFFCSQFLVVLLISIVVAVIDFLKGVDIETPVYQDLMLKKIGVWVFIFLPMVQIAVVAALTWELTGGLGRKMVQARLGFNPADLKMLVIALGVGLGLGMFFVFLSGSMFSLDPQKGGNELLVMASGSGAAKILFILFALLLAPVVEEFLFRGFLFQGFLEKWGPAWSGFIVTALFVALHFPRSGVYFLALTVLAVFSLLLRIRTNSLYPSMLLHAAYNFSVILPLLEYKPGQG